MKKTKYTFYKNKRFIALAIITVLCMFVYLLWRAVHTLPDYREYGWVALVLGIFLLVAEIASSVEAFVHCVDLSTKIEPELPQIPDSWYPDVDVFIATHNEDEELLFKTASACTYMKYPDKSKVHIYFCDDGNRPWVKDLADRLGIGYFGLADNKEAKAGNLNNAIRQTNSPLISTFDADMIPTSEFLMQTVPYFFLPKLKKDEEGNWIPKEEDEIDEKDKIGFIQTPQSFYNPDLFQYNLYSEGRVPNEQDYFFKQVNVGRNSSNSPIYAGSNTVISREALEEVGGIATGTITEDFETGLMIEARGYKCYAVDNSLAKGLAPTTIGSLIKQRERWARGCIYSLRRHRILFNPKIPFKMKLSYLACRSYWDSFLRRFIYILSPIFFALLGIPAVVCSVKELLCIWLPTYILYGITLKVCSGNIRNSRISNIIDTILFPYLMVPILAEVLHIHKKEFVVTVKKKQDESEVEKFLAIPHMILFVLSLIALAICIKDLLVYEAFGAAILIYWLFVNCSSLIMSVFFMFGRKNYRTSERFHVAVPVKVMVDGLPYESQTVDISEGGLSTIFPKAIYIAEEDEVDVEVWDKHYQAKMKMKVASVSNVKDKGYKYSFKITEMDEATKREYFQIIYDREHTLPQVISRKSSVYGDISSNIARRINNNVLSSRKLARMEINKEYSLVSGEKVFLENFNFEYIVVSNKSRLRNELQIVLKPGLVMECYKVSGNLFKVDNLDELQDNPDFKIIVSEWDMYEE